MIQINTIEDRLRLFEQPGWEKTAVGNGYVCRPNHDIGKGSVRVYGDPQTCCYIQFDFSYSEGQTCLFAVEEPYIEISSNAENAFVENSTGADDLIAGRGLNCHINLGNLKVARRFPAGTKFWMESLVVREKFLQRHMPAFLENDIFTLAAAIRSGGIADPRIAVLFKQLGAFPLQADYGQTYLTGKVYEALALLQDKANQVKWDKPNLSLAEIKRLKDVLLFMKDQYQAPLDIAALTKRFGLNRNKLQMGVHVLTGYTVHECLLNIRVQEATTLLAGSDQSIAEIADAVGFKSAKSLYDAFGKFLGVTPRHFRKTLRKAK